MMDYITDLVNKLEDSADTRAKQYPFTGLTFPIIVVVAYWSFIKKIGPTWMKNRPAYNIKPIIQMYNLVQMAINGLLPPYAVYLVLKSDNYHCILSDTNSTDHLTMIFLAWMYYALKLVDLCDTVFFVLRKKYNSITTLHTYHHTLMAVTAWFIFRYYPGGEAAILAILNSFVHSVMYFYYFYSLQVKSTNIWWKKYLTQLQLIQFTIIFLWYTPKIFWNGDCNYPKYLYVFISLQAIVMLKMFGSYYYNAFIVKHKKAN